MKQTATTQQSAEVTNQPLTLKVMFNYLTALIAIGLAIKIGAVFYTAGVSAGVQTCVLLTLALGTLGLAHTCWGFSAPNVQVRRLVIRTTIYGTLVAASAALLHYYGLI